MEPWRTALVDSDATHIWVRGHDITTLMRQATFVDVIYLLHRGHRPTTAERELLDALLIASADHGAGAPSCATARLAASGNRQALSAAVAAGLLAIGDEHGGAGANLMVLIGESAARAKAEGVSLEAIAGQVVEESQASGRRLPGYGHRKHTVDPRVAVLFAMARERNLAGDGVAFVEALEGAIRARVTPLPANIDAALAALLYDLGFPPPAGKFIFMIARVAGLTAEVAEELAREKPMRIRIPVVYDGEPHD